MSAYPVLDVESLRAWLGTHAEIAARLGGEPGAWSLREVGDGNLNQVFIVHGPAGGLCVKQALPYVRLVGPSWPLPPERAFFEQECLTIHGRAVGGLVPALHHYEPELFLIVMELLEPHVIMRRGMIDGIIYPHFADAITTYMARSLFLTSALALPAARTHALVGTFAANVAQRKITEDLVFTDPYRPHPLNRWTSPQLDPVKLAFEQDGEAKLAAQRLKGAFLTSAQALIHGDLHTGSIMVTPEDTRVIDPEFAFMGPMGFDVGSVLGNLLINYFAQAGHATAAAPRQDYQAWVLETVEGVWHGFEAKFLALWREEGKGDLYPVVLFAEDPALLEGERRRFMARLLQDSLGFAAVKMIRRILGLAHNIDLEAIPDPERRAACERRCLDLARRLLVDTRRFASIEAVTGEAREIEAAPPA